ncbi:MAG: glutamate racemase [Methylobacteriaceae bacterium]|nr:glutamate racemase [Methylobacteriaceae bacterium]
MQNQPRILVFDSGLGGLTVFSEVAKVRPDAAIVYAADDAGFPYGPLSEVALVARVVAVVGNLIEAHAPDLVVVACNTASTLVLPHLRARWPQVPFVGTVPAIKPAAAASRTKIIAVIATPGTVARDYTRALISDYAAGCRVVLVGSARLAGLAEAHMRGEAIEDEVLREEIAPCFVEEDGRRTDVIVLACTHYPLLIDCLERQAPWPVTWIDPAPAIARQAARVLAERLPGGPINGPIEGQVQTGHAVFTSGAPIEVALDRALRRRGLVPLMSAAVAVT